MLREGGSMRKLDKFIAFTTAGAVAFALSTYSMNPTSAAASKKAPFKLQVIGTESGGGAPYGKENLTDFKVAAKEINASGGVDGHKLVLTLHDSSSSPTRAAEIVRSLASNALIIEGPDLTSTASAAFPVAKAAHVPMVAGGISGLTVLTSGRPWTFDAFTPTNVFLPAVVKEWLTSLKLKGKSLGAIIDTQDAGTKAQGTLMLTGAKADGNSVTDISVQTGLPTYASQAAQIASSHPAGVFLCDETDSVAAEVHALRTAGVTAPILLCTASFTSSLPPLIASDTNVYGSAVYFTGLKGKPNKTFVREFEKYSTGTAPGAIAPREIAAVDMIVKAVEKTGALNGHKSLTKKRDAIRKYLSKIKHWPGLTGTMTMEKGGYLLGPTSHLIVKFQNGKVSLYKA